MSTLVKDIDLCGFSIKGLRCSKFCVDFEITVSNLTPNWTFFDQSGQRGKTITRVAIVFNTYSIDGNPDGVAVI